MEDLNTVAADCVVICCCCQCLILQILVFALLRLPAKLVKRTRDFAKRKLDRRRRGRGSGEIDCSGVDEIVRRIKEEEHRVRVRAEREEEEEEGRGVRGENKCMEEIEKVMMELHEKGEFGFGSFWRRGKEWEESGSCVPAITLNQIEDEEDDDHFVKCQLIQMVGSLTKL